MKNKEQKIVRLLDEGFSYETIKKMSNLHINKIYNSINEAESVNTTTYDTGDPNDVNSFNDLENKDELDIKAGNNQITVTSKGEQSEEDMIEDDNLDDSVEKLSGYDPYAGNSPGNTEGPAGYKSIFEDIDEDAVIEELFGNSKKKMKTPITTLGMFEGELEEKSVSQQQQKIMGLALSVKRGDTPRSEVSKDVLDMVDGMTEKELEDFASTKHKDLPKKVQTNEGTKCWKGYEKKGMKTMFGKRVPNCVKKESKEEKVRQIEESILSLINKSQGKMFTKKDILEQGPSIAPVKPTVKPGVRPERGTPYKPKHSPKPKAGTEVKPARPTVKPGVRPERGTPYKPKHSPKPKAGEEQGLPEFLKFNNLNIKFRDE